MDLLLQALGWIAFGIVAVAGWKITLAIENYNSDENKLARYKTKYRAQIAQDRVFLSHVCDLRDVEYPDAEDEDYYLKMSQTLPLKPLRKKST